MTTPNLICTLTGLAVLLMFLWCLAAVLRARRKSNTWRSAGAIARRDEAVFCRQNILTRRPSYRPSREAARVMLANILTRLDRNN